MKERNPRFRGIALGYPKAGKTGMLAGLVNSGRFRLGLLDFDGNPDPLYAFVHPEFRDRVSIKTLEDNLRDMGQRIGVSGEPTAFRDCLRALDHWVDDEGRDFGPVKTWVGGAGTLDNPAWLLCLDTLTSMGEAAFRRRRYFRPSGSKGEDTDSDWGQAMRDQAYMMEILSQSKFQCHVLANSHIKVIEPKLLREQKSDAPEVKEAKAQISAMRAEKGTIRQCPSALGQQLPPEIARFFPSVILVRQKENGQGREIVTRGEPGLDLGVPAPHLKRTYPLETGLLSVIDAVLGAGNEGEGDDEN